MLAVVSLIHQDKARFDFMLNNLKEFIRGDFIWIVHYNGEESLGSICHSWAN